MSDEQTADTGDGDDMVLIDLKSPFGDLSKDQIKEIYVKMGERHSEEYTKSLNSLNEALLKTDPVLVLGLFSYYFLGSIVDLETAEIQEPELTQDKIEMLQALFLRNEITKYKPESLNTDVTEIRDLIQKIGNAFHMSRFTKLAGESTDEERKVLMIQESIRTHTQIIRNWSYPGKMRSITAGLFAPFEEVIEKELGVKVEGLLTMFSVLEGKSSGKKEEFTNSIREFFRKETHEEVLDEYRKFAKGLNLSEDEAHLQELLKLSQEQNKTPDQLAWALVNLAEQAVPGIYTFQFEDFVSAYPQPVDREKLRSLIEKWSYKFGDLAGENIDFCFMANPIWKKPLINISGKEFEFFYLPIPTVTHSFCLEMMQDLVMQIPDLKQKYEKHRSDYLEDNVHALLTRYLPESKVYKNVEWADPSKPSVERETDHLVIWENFIVIGESKSHSINDMTRRGAEKSLRQKVEKLIVDPSNQSKDFENFLLAQKENPIKLMDKSGNSIDIQISPNTRFIRFNATLEMLAGSIPCSKILKEGKLISPEDPIAPTISLSDLELLFEVLEKDYVLLHYLSRRMNLEDHSVYIGDEMDLLVFYLKTGFNIHETDADAPHLILSSLSKELDPYFQRHEIGVDFPKPKMKLTPFWEVILSEILNMKNGGRIECAHALLGISHENQEGFEQSFKDAIIKVHENANDDFHGATAFVTNIGSTKRAFIGIIARKLDKDKFQRLTASSIEKCGAHEAAIYAIDVSSIPPPKRFIGFMRIKSPDPLG